MVLREPQHDARGIAPAVHARLLELLEVGLERRAKALDPAEREEAHFVRGILEGELEHTDRHAWREVARQQERLEAVIRVLWRAIGEGREEILDDDVAMRGPRSAVDELGGIESVPRALADHTTPRDPDPNAEREAERAEAGQEHSDRERE